MAKHWKSLVELTRTEMVRNILDVYLLATEGEREYGESWYRTAHAAAARIAREYGSDVQTVAAVISALSPSNKWHRNLIDAERFVEAYAAGEPQPTASTYKRNADKAWAILIGELEPDEAFTGRAFKTRAFYLSIWKPEENVGTVVVDGHAFNIATADRKPLEEVPDLGAKGRYLPVAAAYVAAAELAGLPPQALQATTWLVWRRMADLSQYDLLLTTERI